MSATPAFYRLSQGRLELLTRDDSVLNDQVEMGLIAADEASGSRNRHFVTQALGMSARVTAHVREEELRSGDVYLLCTDGLNDLVSDAGYRSHHRRPGKPICR